MADVIDLNRDIMAACPGCRGTQWHILVDKPDFTEIKGIKCADADCEAETEFVSIRFMETGE